MVQFKCKLNVKKFSTEIYFDVVRMQSHQEKREVDQAALARAGKKLKPLEDESKLTYHANRNFLQP